MKRAFFLTLCLSACMVGPDYEEPAFALPETYRTEFTKGGQDVLWWQGFSDPVLSELVEEALTGNLTVEAAEARLRRAQAFVTAERSDLFPIVDGVADGVVAEGAEPSAGAGLVGAFTPDLFGARRRELRAAIADRAALAALLADERRLAAAALASAYIELRRTDARIALLEQSLDLQQQTLRIVGLRAEAGLAADLDVQRAAADLARTRAQRGPLASSRREADTLISVLIGNVPGEGRVTADEKARVPSFAGGPGAGLPAALLRQRPDLRAAEADLIAATELVGAEAADLYPSLNLTGLLTTEFAPTDIAGETVRRASGVLDVPLLDAGRRRAEVRAAEASAVIALANYERTLLEALREVEVALIAIDAAEARLDDLAEAVGASETAFDQLQALYKEGLATLIDVLDAQRQLIASREQFTNAEATLAQAYVNLYAALGASTGVPG